MKQLITALSLLIMISNSTFASIIKLSSQEKIDLVMHEVKMTALDMIQKKIKLKNATEKILLKKVIYQLCQDLHNEHSICSTKNLI